MIYFFRIEVAGIRVEIECINKGNFAICRDYLSHFDTPDIVVTLTQDEIDAEREVLAIHPDYSPKSIITETDISVEERLVLKKLTDSLISYNTILMHGVVVAKDHYGYMFTGASGIGKSTRASIWLNEFPGSFVVNGDKPFLKITDSEVLACGSPWCGKERWNTNTMVPLHAIFIIERADEDKKNYIEEISLVKAFPTLLEQVYRPSNVDDMRKTIELLKTLNGRIKFYKLHSTPTSDAIRMVYETAKPR